MAQGKHRRTSEAYRALLLYVAKYQSDNGVAPTNHREMARALGTSHSQVGRLLHKALQSGLLAKANPNALVYEIRTPPTSAGLFWVPRVDCSWTRGIRWVRDEADGVWLDRAVYGITRGSEGSLWALAFPDSAVDRGAGVFKLTGSATALVRECANDAMQYRQWYVIERANKTVLVRMLAKRTKGSCTFNLGSMDPEPVTIEANDIVRVSEILMLTVRPAPPPLSQGKKGS